MVESGIIVVASLNPHKECQDRVRIFGTGGYLQDYEQQTTKTLRRF